MLPPPASPELDQKVIVDVGQFVVSTDPAITLVTYSLGSGLGISLYDPTLRAGGLLHAMLPDSATDPERAALQPGTFVNTGLAALLCAARDCKIDPARAQICVAGGAHFMDDSGFFDLGLRNYQRLTAALEDLGLRLAAHSVGGLVSRSIRLSLANGEVRLKTSGMTMEKVLYQG